MENKTYDICIIGSGMMGLVLANELKDTGKKMCIIESGKLSEGSKQKKVESVDLEIKDITRERGLGGSTQTWWGLTGLLDVYDLSQQEGIKYSGWPITYDELMKYCARAGAEYDFPSLNLYADKEYKHTPITNDESLTGEVFAAKQRPLRFGEAYASVLERKNIDFINEATVREILVDEQDQARAVSCVNKNGEHFEVAAKSIVLAAGGIENSRILLLSNSKQKSGLGNATDQVGRCFMNHPKGFYGKISKIQYKKLQKHLLTRKGDIRSYVGISLSEQERQARGLLHPYVQLCPEYPWSGNQTFETLMRLTNSLRGRHVTQEGFSTYDGGGKNQNLYEVAKGFYYFVAAAALKICKKRYPISAVRIRNYIDMAPNPKNRITLSDEVDEYGMRIAKVDMSLGELEKESLIQLHEHIRRISEQENLGILESDLATESVWPVTTDAAHHMGGTRMGTDPETSVVDENFQVHGTKNIFVAGTSVMPTGGNINPSLIGVALTVRLADHLKTNV